MKFEYKGYQLELDVTLDKEGSIYWKATCNELSNFSFCFSPGLFRSLDGAISKFKQEIDRFLPNKEIKKEDKEVQLVNQFISDLNQVLDEMEVVEKNVYYEVVLEAKLMRLMKTYGDSLCLGSSINVYRSHYNHIVKQREEKKKPKMSILDNKRNVITLSYKIIEDGYIEE